MVRKLRFQMERCRSFTRWQDVGDSMNFINITSHTGKNNALQLVLSHVMNRYHVKRCQAAVESEVVHTPLALSLCRSAPNRWTHDPFVKFPVDLTPSIRGLLH